MTVYLVTSGDGSDGDEWQVHCIFTTEEAAIEYIRAYNNHRPKWAELSIDDIECWEVDVPFDHSKYPHDPIKVV